MIDPIYLTLAQQGPAAHGVAPTGETSSGGPSATAAPGTPGVTGASGTTGIPGSPVAPASKAPSSSSPLGGNGFFLVLFVVLGVFLFMSFNGQRKEKKRRKQLLDNLKKGDKVATVSGIIGSVVELRDQEVVLKVDENSNTRIKFRKAAIESVLEERGAGASE